MADMNVDRLAQLPEEMLSFTISTALRQGGPRAGELARAGRQAIRTPNFLANTSRGIVPHISQDVFQKNTGINGVYMAYEDCKFNAFFSVP
jgi:queuine tRNA-ribosyltransferase subunit QTRTD1